jgi:two-component system sensor histidine kinase UhpB
LALSWLPQSEDVGSVGDIQPVADPVVAVTSRLVRQHVARELHDRVVQTLQLMLLDMERFRLDQPSPKVKSEVGDYQRSTREAINQLREVLYELREEPPVNAGFVDALGNLLKGYERRSGIAIQLAVSRHWPSVLRTVAAVNIRRIVEEAVNNMWRHSGTANAKVVLGQVDSARLLLLVRDYGQGLGELRVAGVGMKGMQERALLLGGDLSIHSVRNSGTVVRAVFPRESVI